MNEQTVIHEVCADAGISTEQDRPWDLRVHNQNFYGRVFAGGALALGETYMMGWWDTDDLFEFFVRLLSSSKTVDRKNVGWRTKLAFMRARLLNMQTISQNRRLADTHYNLSTELFEHMLGPTMAYSCGYWRNANSLDAAQIAKFDLLCEKLQLSPGERVLDIGCGWGGFARHAARNYGVDVVGITIAEEQAQYATELCHGLPVEIVCCDYRDFKNRYNGELFDKVISIGMMEHVGPKNYKALFDMVLASLKPSGIFALHTIGSRISTETGDPWLTTYIFPGGVLPSMRQLSEAAEDQFVLQDVQNIGVHYTPTLLAWLNNFDAYCKTQKRTKDLPQIWGSTEAFCRMWRYYLSCCAAEFRVGGSTVWQLIFTKGHMPGGYIGAR